MGTEHLGVKQSSATKLSDDEVVENMIDWLENAGFQLLPWQANALRAILLREHIITPDGHRIPIPAGYTKAPPVQRRGFEQTQVILDEARPTVSYCDCPYGGDNPKCVVHGDGRKY